MDKLYDLKQMLVEELEHQGEKQLTRESLEVIDKLAHAGKNVAKIIQLCEEEEGGSFAGDGSYEGSMAGGSYRGSYAGPFSGGANGREGSYRRGMSRAGGSYRRDSMGRYSREAGYSRDNKEFAEQLRKMGLNLPENFRGEIMRMADQMEQMQG